MDDTSHNTAVDDLGASFLFKKPLDIISPRVWREFYRIIQN